MVIVSATPLGIDSEWRIYHERTEEPSKQAADFGLLACTSRSAQGRGVVGHIEQNWIRVISGRCGCYRTIDSNMVMLFIM